MTYRSRTTPRDHQLREFEENRDKPKRGLFWSMRSGKTKACIDLAEYLFHEKGITGIVVLAPNGVHDNWVRQEFPVHCSTPYIGAVYTASNRERNWHKKALHRLLSAPKDRLAVLAVNSETMWREHAKKVMGRFLSKHKGGLALFVDESHDYRTPSSKRFKTARAYAKHCDVVRILTGTPDSNSPLAHWAQFELLEPQALGFRTFTEFKQHHTILRMAKTKSGRQFEQIVKFVNMEELKGRLSKWVSVVRKEDAGLQPVIDHPLTFHMTDKQRSVYEKVRKELMLDDMVLDGGALLGKLQQISRGWYYKEDKTVELLVKPADNPSLQALFNAITECEGKTIVWARHREEAEQIAAECEEREINYVLYRGGMASQDKADARSKFQTNNAVKVFIGQPKAGGVGIDLSNAEQIIWYSHVFDLIDYEQATERASAVWKEQGVDVFQIMAHNSVDDYIIGAHKRKADISDELSGSGLQRLLASYEML